MRRRNLIFGLLAVATMGGAHAQESKKAHRIAIVDPSHPADSFAGTSDEPLVKAFFGELHRLGYLEGDNLLIERYSGEGRAAHYPDLARDVVRRNPDLIIAFTTDLALDFKAATITIPIVCIFGRPVEAGIVPSLARPGGNITGVAVDIWVEQWGKRIQLLRQVVPHLTTLEVLETRAQRATWEAQAPEVGRRWGVTYVFGQELNHPANEAEYRRVFASLAQAGVDGIMVADSAENVANRKVIVELAEKYRLPVIYPFKVLVEAGGLMSYGVDAAELGRRTAAMTGQILKGAKPAEIPVFQPTKFELAINLKTAKALGLTVPPELLATADEVIE
jgi:putative tryptophan/tyrosine transport system substrate-binding protein